MTIECNAGWEPGTEGQKLKTKGTGKLGTLVNNNAIKTHSLLVTNVSCSCSMLVPGETESECEDGAGIPLFTSFSIFL